MFYFSLDTSLNIYRKFVVYLLELTFYRIKENSTPRKVYLFIHSVNKY